MLMKAVQDVNFTSRLITEQVLIALQNIMTSHSLMTRKYNTVTIK